VSRLAFDKSAILKNINIVLVDPQIPENIGLIARVLKNTSIFCFSLVNPNLNRKSFEVAKRAKDVLQKARVFESLSEAIKDSHFVFGSTRRRREYKTIYNFRQILPQIVSLASSRKVSILFGKENFGLSREEIETCDSIFYLPANPKFSSYNLAFSVGIVCYQIFDFVQNILCTTPLDLAKKKDIEALFVFIKKSLSSNKFDTKLTNSILFSLKRLFTRTHLTKREVELLKMLFIKFLPHPCIERRSSQNVN
jgi:TrmH family RNA methyltransferase